MGYPADLEYVLSSTEKENLARLYLSPTIGRYSHLEGAIDSNTVGQVDDPYGVLADRVKRQKTTFNTTETVMSSSAPVNRSHIAIGTPEPTEAATTASEGTKAREHLYLFTIIMQHGKLDSLK